MTKFVINESSLLFDCKDLFTGYEEYSRLSEDTRDFSNYIGWSIFAFDKDDEAQDSNFDEQYVLEILPRNIDKSSQVKSANVAKNSDLKAVVNVYDSLGNLESSESVEDYDDLQEYLIICFS